MLCLPRVQNPRLRLTETPEGVDMSPFMGLLFRVDDDLESSAVKAQTTIKLGVLLTPSIKNRGLKDPCLL
jgi:hypothetical protein